MGSFDIKDLHLSVANYFAKKEKHCILLTFEESERLFHQPFDMVTVNSEGETDGIMVMYYEDQLEEVKESNLPLESGLNIQNTWICMAEDMLEASLPKLDEFTGILIHTKMSDTEWNISLYRKADKMHDYPHPTATLLELLNIQAANYWRLINFNIMAERVMSQFNKTIKYNGNYIT